MTSTGPDLDAIRDIIVGLFGEDPKEAPRHIMSELLSPDSESIKRLHSFLEENKEEDLLQMFFQYYLADRDTIGQDFTPSSIGRLLARLTHEKNETVYDLCAGSGSLTIQKWQQDPSAHYVCEELDPEAIPFLLLNLSLRKVSATVIHRDALTKDATALFLVEDGVVRTGELADDPIVADTVISNPPYNLKWDAPEPMFADDRFRNVIPSKSNANYAFVLTALNCLNDGGKAVFVLPNGSLTSDIEKEPRRYLVDQGHLEAVILLPERMFAATSIPVCVHVYGVGGAPTVSMIDARQMFHEEVRRQRGQFGGASHTERVYRKTLNIFSEEDLDEITGAMTADIPGFSAIVTREQIAQQDYNLSPSRYIELVTEPHTHRPFEDIIDDINRIAIERNVVKITANETIAREAGLIEVWELHQESRDTTDKMGKTFALFGKEPVKPDYIRLTKSREFKMENVSKEVFSNLFAFVLPIWAQHIHYLNTEENRLLAELRDALLPKLMNGEIRLEQSDKTEEATK